MVPSIGRIVHYKLNAQDADQINARRDNYGGQCNTATVGDVYPALIVRTWGKTEENAVQLQVFIDGNFTYWATSRQEGEAEGQFQWPQVSRG